jgi:hypothetical protein
MLWRSRSIMQYTAISLTYKIKATGSQRVGEITVLVFLFFLCWVCWLCVISFIMMNDMVWCIGHSNLAHKPSPSYVNTSYGT